MNNLVLPLIRRMGLGKSFETWMVKQSWKLFSSLMWRLVKCDINLVDDFWTALQDFRDRVDLESIDDDSFDNLRDKSTGREVNL